MNFFTADLHFGHANVIRYCDRPYATAEEMDRDLIARWNARVDPKDEIYILGDFSFKSAAVWEGYLVQLNGHKHLIVGNHDYAAGRGLKRIRSYFREIVPYKELVGESGCQFVLMHYPILFWNGSVRDDVYHLYGHIHNSAYCMSIAAHLAHSLNVGVDVCNYAPLSEAEVLLKIAKLDQKRPQPFNESAREEHSPLRYN